MLVVERISDLYQHVGQELGPSGWRRVTQREIDLFAGITGDEHWIHVDRARAAAELPLGKTIAHGLLTLSVTAGLVDTLLQVRRYRRGLNYGCNRVRFTAPVPEGSSLRLRLTIREALPIDGGVRLTLHNVVEVDDRPERPAMVAETVVLMYD
ncbi:MaoC family dehydratase [Azospirillum sp. HJ39]|uniref:MaoC family dehydratase n=1 Tax=Azospirillum sp. HJ39 TaxID=3159496 RepID=UPI0035584920